MSTHLRPLPRINADDERFWRACRAHRLELPRCRACGLYHLPPGPVCPYCFSSDLDWVTASGKGTISSAVTVHKAWFPAFADDIPYHVVQVELEEGVRLTAGMIAPDDAPFKVGTPVQVMFHEASPDVTLPFFRPVK